MSPDISHDHQEREEGSPRLTRGLPLVINVWHQSLLHIPK